MIVDEAISIIKEFEGCRLTVYTDAAGFKTIGYGHRLLPNELYSAIPQDLADKLLLEDIAEAESRTKAHLNASMNVNQYSALVSLVFNEGVSPLLGTLGELINNGCLLDPLGIAKAADEFDRWVYVHINGRPTMLAGLVSRRTAEKKLFLTPIDIMIDQ